MVPSELKFPDSETGAPSVDRRDRPNRLPIVRGRVVVAWRRLRKTRPRVCPTGWTTWLVLGMAAAATTALGELSQLLADIASKGQVSYSAAVFTSFTFAPAESAHELADAVRLWCPPDGSALCRLGYVYIYVCIDALVFAPSLAYLLYRVMTLVGLPTRVSRLSALALLAVYELETVSIGALVHLDAGESWYVLPRSLSTVKWIGAAAALAIVLAAWASKNLPGAISLQRERGQDAEQAGSHLRAAAKLAGPIIVLALFLTLVALPAGGPLDQLPDVLRNQISEFFELHNPWPLLGSVFGLGLFFLALLVAGMWITSGPAERRAVPSTQRMIDIALAVGLALFTVEGFFGVPNPWIGFVPVGLIVGLALVDFAVRRLGLHATVVESAGRRSPATERLASGWVPILPALAVMGSGVGLLRATVKPLVLGMHPQLPWLAGTVVAVVVTVFAGPVTAWISRWMLTRMRRKKDKPGWWWWIPEVAAVALLIPTAVVLAVRPQAAVHLTSGGTIAICLGFIVLVVGGLHFISQRSEPWAVTARLRLGRLGTPWVGIAVVVWLAANVLSGAGGYHDIRVYPNGPAATYDEPSAAVRSWLNVVAKDPGCVEQIASPATVAKQPIIKMIMVAAPGGGIRASYWTASGLDAMTASTACGASNIFAVSGVSGGSVGAAAWLASPGRPARDTVRSLATDNALAASTASLFLRDIPQPFFGAGTLWRDRSAVMEDTWTSQAGSVFGTAQDPLRFSGLGAQRTWAPVVMFNGSSVTDGCRVLVTNVARVPAGPSACEPATEAGALPGSLDAMAGLHPDLGGDGARCSVGGRGDMSLLTAALLSARFPVISSSGVFDRCSASDHVRTTYDVDGGYYENSGLLSLLQFWENVRPVVQACNALAAAPGSPATGACPIAGTRVQIEPWIVVLDNHYESPATAAPVPRQDELTIPVQALMNSSNVMGQANLEVTASIAMKAFLLEAPDGMLPATGRFARIGPSKRPTVEAPLGWVLSQTARCGLDEQLMNYAPEAEVVDRAKVEPSDGCTTAVDRGGDPDAQEPLAVELTESTPQDQ